MKTILEAIVLWIGLSIIGAALIILILMMIVGGDPIAVLGV